MASRHRWQLGMVDRALDGVDQPRHVPAPPQEPGVDAQDAGAAAAAQSYPGSLRKPEGHRSGASENEYRGDEPVSREGREPGEWLRSNAPHDAGSVRVLRAAHSSHRVAGGLIRLVDQGSIAAGSVFRYPDSGVAHDVLAAEDDAGHRRSHAASDDDVDADRVRLYLSDDCGRDGAVLVCQQRLGNRAAVLHELADRTSGRSHRPAGGGATAEKRRNRAHRRRGEAFLTMAALTPQITRFVQDVVSAMGVALTVNVEETSEGTRINLEGEDGGVLVRRGGEGLQALQHLVATAFRKQLGDDNRIVIDCNGFRKDKDAELRQMARFVAEKARSSGMPQEMGPLNPYERRIVHLAIAEDPSVTSESIGDAFLKTVIISTKR